MDDKAHLVAARSPPHTNLVGGILGDPMDVAAVQRYQTDVEVVLPFGGEDDLLTVERDIEGIDGQKLRRENLVTVEYSVSHDVNRGRLCSCRAIEIKTVVAVRPNDLGSLDGLPSLGHRYRSADTPHHSEQPQPCRPTHAAHSSMRS